MGAGHRRGNQKNHGARDALLQLREGMAPTQTPPPAIQGFTLAQEEPVASL